MRRAIICILFVGLAGATFAQSTPDPRESDSSSNHLPGLGFLLVSGKEGSVRFDPFVSLRYLNQKLADRSYTDAFGRTINVPRREDFQLQKVVIYFRGWMFVPEFRYVLYAWTSNANTGQATQVVVAGNIQYDLRDYLGFGGGIIGLPTSRSMLYNWPGWLRQDARPMAEEFFRGSFTFGAWIQGVLHKQWHYKSVLGNNLSQLGIDAGQLDNGFDTWSTMLWWSSPDYGRTARYGDFEKHQHPSLMFGAAFTRSNETRQSQPHAEDPENVQIRLSDGTVIFSPNAFNNGSQVNAAKYQMASCNGGIKYHGFSLDGEFFARWITNFEFTGNLPVRGLFDNGFTAQASAMVIDKTIQVYGVGSYINGQYGKPWEINGGVNWYLRKDRLLRANAEVIYTYHSPVGYLTYPTAVGATGAIFMLNLEINY